MKKLLYLLILLVLLLGCEVKDKMVIQYGDYKETVLVERVESELGFVIDVIHGVEYREDLEARTFEIVEPYSLSITVRDDVEEMYDLYSEFSVTNMFRDPNVGRPNVFGLFHPISARLPYFDMFIIGEGTEDAIFYLIKEAEDLHYIVQFIIPTVNQLEQFSEIRGMLTSFEILGYKSETRYYLRDDIAPLDRFRGNPENVTINHFRYYEEDKEPSMYAEDLPSIVGDISKRYVDDSELYKEKIWEIVNGAPPTNLLRNINDNINQEEEFIYYSAHGSRFSDGGLRLNFLELVPPYQFQTNLIFGYFSEGLTDIHIIEEQEVIVEYGESHLLFEYVGKEEIYYFIYVEILDEEKSILDSMVEIVHVPSPAFNIELSLEKDVIRPEENLQLNVNNKGTYNLIGNGEYTLEKYVNGEWWTIPFDGYYINLEYGTPGFYHSQITIQSGEEFKVDNIITKGLEAGQYRIVHPFSSPYSTDWLRREEFVLAVPFTIEEPINNQ